MNAVAIPDTADSTTDVGLKSPQAGTWQIMQAPDSPTPVAGVQYALGEHSPTAKATVTGAGDKRVLHYRPRTAEARQGQRATGDGRQKAFTYSYIPPANSAQVLVSIVASDGRHVQRVVKAKTRRGAVAVQGSLDAVTVAVTGIAANGSHGPTLSAKAKLAAPGNTHKQKR